MLFLDNSNNDDVNHNTDAIANNNIPNTTSCSGVEKKEVVPSK